MPARLWTRAWCCVAAAAALQPLPTLDAASASKLGVNAISAALRNRCESARATRRFFSLDETASYDVTDAARRHAKALTFLGVDVDDEVLETARNGAVAAASLAAAGDASAAVATAAAWARGLDASPLATLTRPLILNADDACATELLAAFEVDAATGTRTPALDAAACAPVAAARRAVAAAAARLAEAAADARTEHAGLFELEKNRTIAGVGERRFSEGRAAAAPRLGRGDDAATALARIFRAEGDPGAPQASSSPCRARRRRRRSERRSARAGRAGRLTWSPKRAVEPRTRSKTRARRSRPPRPRASRSSRRSSAPPRTRSASA